MDVLIFIAIWLLALWIISVFKKTVRESIMKKLLFFPLFLLLIYCSQSFEKQFAKINIGMSESQVVELIGEPQNKQTLPFNVKWWNYVEQDALVVFQNDTVKKTITNAKAEIEKMNAKMDSLSNSMKDLFKK